MTEEFAIAFFLVSIGCVFFALAGLIVAFVIEILSNV